VLCYLKETAELKLKFKNLIIKITEIINKIKGYIDSNYADNVLNKKSIIDYVFFIN